MYRIKQDRTVLVPFKIVHLVSLVVSFSLYLFFPGSVLVCINDCGLTCYAFMNIVYNGWKMPLVMRTAGLLRITPDNTTLVGQGSAGPRVL